MNGRGRYCAGWDGPLLIQPPIFNFSHTQLWTEIIKIERRGHKCYCTSNHTHLLTHSSNTCEKAVDKYTYYIQNLSPIQRESSAAMHHLHNLRFVLVLAFAVGFHYCCNASPNNKSIPAVFVFGDSIVDPGNNNNLKTIVKCNFPPYGKDFKGGVPTGRFSNGRVPSDFLAELFGVKYLLPAYMDGNLQAGDLITGVGFASGGAGYDPLTAKLVSVLSLSDQLELFKDYLRKLKAAVGEDRANKIISQAIFIVCAGSDDLANTYFTTPFRKSEYNVASYTDLMATSASSFLEKLYGLGARRIGVVSTPPIGCVPSQRTLHGGIIRDCAEAPNQAAELFNSKLSSTVTSLGNKLPGVVFIYMDIYSLLLDLILHPTNKGFEEVNKGCCGTGTVEVSVLCNSYSPQLCTDASKYVFWDSYHPTEAAYKHLVQILYRKYSTKF